MRLRLPPGRRNEATRSERIASAFAARGRPARSLRPPAEYPSCCTLIQRLQCTLRELAIVPVPLDVQERRDPRRLALDGGRGCRRRTSFERVPGEGGRNGCLSLGRTPGLMFHGVTVRLRSLQGSTLPSPTRSPGRSRMNAEPAQKAGMWSGSTLAWNSRWMPFVRGNGRGLFPRGNK